MDMTIEEWEVLAARGQGDKMTEANGTRHLCGCGHWGLGQLISEETAVKSLRDFVGTILGICV